MSEINYECMNIDLYCNCFTVTKANTIKSTLQNSSRAATYLPSGKLCPLDKKDVVFTTTKVKGPTHLSCSFYRFPCMYAQVSANLQKNLHYQINVDAVFRLDNLLRSMDVRDG